MLDNKGVGKGLRLKVKSKGRLSLVDWIDGSVNRPSSYINRGSGLILVENLFVSYKFPTRSDKFPKKNTNSGSSL